MKLITGEMHKKVNDMRPELDELHHVFLVVF